jgi:hypothetical protein
VEVEDRLTGGLAIGEEQVHRDKVTVLGPASKTPGDPRLLAPSLPVSACRYPGV